MFRKKTIFVIGAGASKDLKFPLGNELRDKIIALLRDVGQHSATNSDSLLLRIAFQNHSQQMLGQYQGDAYFAAALRIAQQLHAFRSIDEFVDFHSGDAHIEFVAKAAICLCILKAEEQSSIISKIGERRFVDLAKLDSSGAWLIPLWHLLRDGTNLINPLVAFNNVKFIIFNYDRSLELFFSEMMRTLFNFDQSAIETAMTNLHIIHPYGTVGPFYGSGRSMLPYGAQPHHQLSALASSVRTFGESERDPNMMLQLASWLNEAEQIITIGFAFHDQNLEFLKRERTDLRIPVYGTGYNEPAEVIEDFREAIARTVGLQPDDVLINNKTGADLLKTYGKRMTR